MKDKLPPQNIEAEQSVLGAMLLEPQVKYEISDLLPTGKLFYRDIHGLIFDAVMAVPAPDTLTVADELQRRGQLDAIGGASYLVQLFNATPTWIHARHYAGIVARCAFLRQIIQAGYEIADLPYQSATDVDAAYSKAVGILGAVQPPGTDRDILAWYPSLINFLAQTMDRIGELDAPRAAARVPVRFPWRALSGADKVPELLAGTMSVIVAETGAGKTAFAECCAEDWAERGLHIVFVHLELSHEFMCLRRTCRQTGIPLAKLLHPLADPADMHQVSAATDRLSHWPGSITYVHAAGWTARKIAATIERLAQRQPMNAFLVDYLGMIEVSGTDDHDRNMAQVRGQQVKVLKDVAERLGVPGLLLAQFNNEADSHKWQKARAIRDSGEPRQKANLIVTLDRPVLDAAKVVEGRFYNPGDLDPLAKVVVEKQTAGRPFADWLFFDGPRYLWRDCTVSKEEFNQ